MSFSFNLTYAGKLVYTEIVPSETHFSVLFNRKAIAGINLNDAWMWQLSAGSILPRSVTDEIGMRIENYFE